MAEKLKDNPENMSEQQILKGLIKDMEEKANLNKVKMVRKFWFSVNQAWFDQECKDYMEKLTKAAANHGFDLRSNASQFKKLKEKERELTKNYFKLIDSKKLGHDRDAEKENKAKNKNKKKKKKKAPKSRRWRKINQTSLESTRRSHLMTRAVMMKQPWKMTTKKAWKKMMVF